MVGKKVLIIGGSSGIGHEVARQLVAAGAAVVITGRDEEKLRQAAANLGVQASTACFDAHDHDALTGFFASTGNYDHVVSLVGDSMSGGFLSITTEVMRHTLHSKFLTNWMIARLSAGKINKGGSITFTSGTGGRPHEVSATYVANSALSALVQGIAVELAPEIRANAVAPTFMGTKTAFWKHVAVEELEDMMAGFTGLLPLQAIADVSQVASSYLHLMTNKFITGQVLSVDGGIMLVK
jgi:NAD(P)-dependent dehydrogenase (short-subunit alcohol dehydrogenase family)